MIPSEADPSRVQGIREQDTEGSHLHKGRADGRKSAASGVGQSASLRRGEQDLQRGDGDGDPHPSHLFQP